MRSKAVSNQGFTLIEVLAALAVVGIAMGAMMVGITQYAQSTEYLRSKTLASWVARNAMVGIQHRESPMKTGTQEGKMEMGNHEWFYTIEIQATPDADIKRATIRVSKEKDEDPLATLSGFFAPLPDEPRKGLAALRGS